MKICLLNSLYTPYERGGADKVVNFIMKGLKKGGAEVFLISGAPYFRQKTDEMLGVYYLRSIFYNIGKIPLFFRFFWHIWDMIDFITLFKVWLIIRKEKPDIVMTHNLMGLSFLIPFLLKKLKTRHIHTLHDLALLHPSGLMIYGSEERVDSFPAKVYQRLCQYLFGAPEIVISPSKWLMGEYTIRGFFNGSAKFILPNPSPSFPDTKTNPEKDENKFTFLYVGQIEDHKGVPFLVKTFVNFWEPFWSSSAGKKERLTIELLIVGPGSKLAEIGKMAYGDKRIKVLGGRAHSDIKEIMQSADCLVVPSLCYENSPTVIYEAILLELPVIASRLGGITELIHESGGILFDPGSEDDLVEKMKYVLENRDKLKNIKIKENRFSHDDYVENLVKLI